MPGRASPAAGGRRSVDLLDARAHQPGELEQADARSDRQDANVAERIRRRCSSPRGTEPGSTGCGGTTPDRAAPPGPGTARGCRGEAVAPRAPGRLSTAAGRLAGARLLAVEATCRRRRRCGRSLPGSAYRHRCGGAQATPPGGTLSGGEHGDRNFGPSSSATASTWSVSERENLPPLRLRVGTAARFSSSSFVRTA